MKRLLESEKESLNSEKLTVEFLNGTSTPFGLV
jgi:hypothetical protein